LLESSQFFADARDRWQTQGFARAWRELLGRFDALPRTLARPDGERALTNLRHLVELLQPEADRHGPGDALLRWFDQQCAGDGNAEAAQLRLDSDRDLVHVVTIHRAKGLEYPVVFCPFLCAPASAGREKTRSIEYHAGGDTHLSFIDDEDAKRARKHESFQEDLRLIYVAVTRAEHRLVLPVGTCVSGPWKAVKPMLRAPLNALVASEGCSLDDWFGDKPTQTVDSIAAGWRAVADKAAGVALIPLADVATALPPTRDDDPVAPPSTLRARQLTRRLQADWRIGSFTGLMRQASRAQIAVLDSAPAASDEPAADHDRPAANAAPEEEVSLASESEPVTEIAPPSPHDILAFPRGALAGESLHAVLEFADFTAPATWPATIDRALRQRPPRHATSPDPAWTVGVRQMLADLTACALPGGHALRLADIPPADRQNEWPFLLPARLAGDALAARLQEAGYALPPLTGAQLDGYLKGIVDLVFRHQGRYYLADWKSNHLGDRPIDYNAAGVNAAMASHGYALQASLYALALHRFLRQRLPGYAPVTHFGGVYYLFIRGARPGWTNADGSPCGVWFYRPAAALLDDLDRLAGA
jgi:exodeoxyribonuclease V beta subunit